MRAVERLSRACLGVADDIEAGRLKLKQLRRNVVFQHNGSCGCSFGHVIHRAGLRSKLGAYHVGDRRNKQPLWTDNCGAFTKVTGRNTKDFDDADPVAVALMELELANDVLSGDARRAGIIAKLRGLSDALAVTP